jgi:hypothetical protein
MSDVFIAMISAGAVLGAAVIPVILTGRKISRERSRHFDEMAARDREMSCQAGALSFDGILSQWDEISRELEDLVMNTPVDRFLILRAWNGKDTPRWATAVYQYRKGNDAPVSYAHVNLDADYVGRLRSIRTGVPIVFSVSELDDSLTRSLYHSEGVKQSAWYHIGDSHPSSSPQSTSIMYCSFGSHSDLPLSENDLVKCHLLVGRVRAFYAHSK